MSKEVAKRKMKVVDNRINQYELSKKAELVSLGNSDKSYNDILSYLNNEIKMSTKMATFNHKILCFKDDGVYQLNKAIEKVYGVSTAQASQKPSGGGDNPIDTIDVTLADGTRCKVPYGEIAMPDLGDGAMIDIGYNQGTNQLYVQGQCQFRFSQMIDEIITETTRLLNTSSIYKDQAIEVGPNCVPKVMDLSNIEKEFMVLAAKTERDLRPLLTRIKQPEKCLAQGIPLKTGILLEGVYGTGKTLLAFKVAKQAIQKNWSFIYLKEPTLLAQTLRLSKTLDNNGHGVIVFLEDVDQVTKGNRDASMQDILNTLDGGDTKNMNVIAMFTTNHIEDIDPTFLRGKRIGTIVSMGPLDAATARLFINHAFETYELSEEVETKDGMLSMEDVCKNLEAALIVPAFMAEIVETVKSNMIWEESNEITPIMLQDSLESYLRQVQLATKKTNYETDATKLYSSMKTLVSDSQKTMAEQVDQVHDHVVN